MVIVSRLGDNLGGELETLLRATLSKMVSSQTTIVIQVSCGKPIPSESKMNSILSI